MALRSAPRRAFAFGMPIKAALRVFGSGETRLGRAAQAARGGQEVFLFGRYHVDTVHRTRRKAESAACAFVADYSVHKLACAHNRI